MKILSYYKNCDECSIPYFYCNQTEGDDIPGSYYDNCVNNGLDFLLLLKKEEINALLV